MKLKLLSILTSLSLPFCFFYSNCVVAETLNETSAVEESKPIKPKLPKRRFPHGCREIGFDAKDNLLILNPAQEQSPQTLYFIHNISMEHSVHLKAVKPRDRNFYPTYENTLQPNQWGAFATDEKLSQFTCQFDSNDGAATDCSKVLELCQYNHVKFSDSTMGNYWVVDSDTLQETVRRSIAIGILLRW